MGQRELPASSAFRSRCPLSFVRPCVRAREPVDLEVPTDLLVAEVEEEKVRFPVHSLSEAVPSGEAELIEEAAALLARAERSATIVDEAGRWSMRKQAGSVAALSDYLKMPVGISGSAFCGGRITRTLNRLFPRGRSSWGYAGRLYGRRMGQDCGRQRSSSVSVGLTPRQSGVVQPTAASRVMTIFPPRRTSQN